MASTAVADQVFDTLGRNPLWQYAKPDSSSDTSSTGREGRNFAGVERTKAPTAPFRIAASDSSATRGSAFDLTVDEAAVTGSIASTVPVGSRRQVTLAQARQSALNALKEAERRRRQAAIADAEFSVALDVDLQEA